MAAGNPYAKNNLYAQYDENKLLMASDEDLTLMLYEGGVKFCNQAIIAIEKKDMITANMKLQKVQDVIRELQITINTKHPQYADINELYNYMYRRTVESNFNKDLEIINEVTDLMKEFRDLWKESVKIAREARMKK